MNNTSRPPNSGGIHRANADSGVASADTAGTVRHMKRVNTLNETVSCGEFSFSGLQASIFVADFQPDGYLPDLVRCVLGPPSPESTSTVPDSEIAPHLATWNERLSAGEIFNGSVLALRSMVIERTAELELPGLRLTFTESDYVTQRATTGAFRALPHERRGELADQVRLGEHTAGRYSSTFGVSLTVVTADDQLVWLRRSESNAVNPGRYTCTTAEGMNCDDVRSGAPDPFLCAARGLHEELGIELSSSELAEICLTALTLNLDWWEWNLLGHIRLADLTGNALDSHTIRQYFQSAQAKDKWETADVAFTPCRPHDVAAFIREHAITNYGAVAAVLALLADRRFSREEVEAAFAGSPVRVGERIVDIHRAHADSGVASADAADTVRRMTHTITIPWELACSPGFDEAIAAAAHIEPRDVHCRLDGSTASLVFEGDRTTLADVASVVRELRDQAA